MKTKDDIIKCLQAHKLELMSRYPLKNIALFGSYARNEQTPDSDVDLLVEFTAPIGFEFLDLAEELEKMLDEKIDLVSRNGIKPHYWPHIVDDAIYV